MEKTDSQPKQAAVDNKSAFAGNINPMPDHDSVDEIVTEAGLENLEGEPVKVKAALEKRDQNRWELDPDSAEDH